ncbi:MAG: ATP-binding cassette domain-containing protein [Pirellulaceae bacterium]
MSVPLIEICELSRLVPEADRPLLDQLNLTIAAGDRLGIAGASGSGKTTLMRAIAALDPVEGGTLKFQGNLVGDLPAFRRQVIYLHQRPAMMAGTVRDNLQLPFSLASSQGSFDELRVVKWLEPLGKSAALLEQAVDTLSGGEQQIVALLRAIQLDPVVLLLDEPTASLDRETVANFERLVDSWFGEKSVRALVWISHDDQQRERMTNRVWEIAEGRIVEGKNQ